MQCEEWVELPLGVYDVLQVCQIFAPQDFAPAPESSDRTVRKPVPNPITAYEVQAKRN